MDFRNIGASGFGTGQNSRHFLPFIPPSRSASVFPAGPPRTPYQRPRVNRSTSPSTPRPTHPATLEIRDPFPEHTPLAPENKLTKVPYPSPPSTHCAQSITSSVPDASCMGHVKPVPLVSFCDAHDDAFIPAYAGPAFFAFTSCFLEDTIEKLDRDMIIRGVSTEMLYIWETVHPEVRETSPLRYEYDSSTSRFIVKCATSPVHESVTIFFTHQVSRALESRLSDDQYLDMVQVSSGSCYRGFNGNGYTAHSKKLPDAYLHIDGYRFPTVVCETGGAESMDDLKQDARLWLLGTEGHTRVVVVVAFTEIPLELPAITTTVEADVARDGSTSGLNNDSEVDAYPEETTLLASIDDATEFLVLAKALLSLHQQRKLRKPLLGSVIATVHLFRPNPAGDGITESFTCTLLPIPTALHAPQSIPLTLGDLLSPDIAIANGLNPDELILLPLDRLRAIVAKQLPKQESALSMDRAMGLMKKRAVWEELPTFAQNKRTKRKRDNEDVQ